MEPVGFELVFGHCPELVEVLDELLPCFLLLFGLFAVLDALVFLVGLGAGSEVDAFDLGADALLGVVVAFSVSGFPGHGDFRFQIADFRLIAL